LKILFQYLLLLLRFRVQLYKQKEFLSNTIAPLAVGFRNSETNRLSKYGIYVPLFIGEAFAVLRGNNIAENERVALTSLGCMTALFDDLFDEGQYNDEFIRNLLENPFEPENETPQLAVLVKLYNLFLNNTKHSAEAKLLMSHIYDAQVASRKQKNPDIGTAELEQITYNKGGFTMQLYRLAFENELTDTENILFYKLGAIGQLENDIFDVYKDFKEGINTLVIIENQIDNLKQRYNSLQREVFAAIEKLHFTNAQKYQFRLICSLIIARGYVAIAQLEKLSAKTNHIFSPSFYSRSELICDMEKPLNRIKLLYYAVKYAKK